MAFPSGASTRSNEATANLRPRRGQRELPRQTNVILSTHDKLTAAPALRRTDVIRQACAERTETFAPLAWQLNSSLDNFGGFVGRASATPESRMPAIHVNSSLPCPGSLCDKGYGESSTQEEGGP